MSTLKFIKDQKYDTGMIFEMLKGKDEQTILEYAKTLKIPPEDATKIAGGNKTLTKTITQQRYAEAGNKLNEVIIAYQEGWNEIDQPFFERLIELTKFPLAHKSYECVVSLFHPGISNWGGKKVARIWNKDARVQRRITAHELIISHFFSLMHKKHPEVTEQKIWQLAEVYAFAITGLDPVMKSFWPWDTTGAYTDHNYPNLIGLQRALSQLAIDDINDFIKKGLVMLLDE